MMNCVLVPLAKIYKEIGVIANTETVRNKSGVPEAFQGSRGESYERGIQGGEGELCERDISGNYTALG